jgi:hypothetical protein
MSIGILVAIRNRNSVEFLGIWERIYNPNSNYGEYAIIRNQAGLNNYKISVKEWAAKLNQVAIQQMRLGNNGKK